jgi:DNA-binding CsgD family transcriptional regulator/tetratricopeptide (TPR) repeat protein
MTVGLVSPVMVGRSSRLAVLRDIFDRVCAGSSTIVLLGGEAGAGKTRLITEFTEEVAGRAVRLSGCCVDLGGDGLAYAPFTATLRDLARQLGADGVAALVPGAAPGELGRLLPALGSARPPNPGYGEDAGAPRARLFEELLGLLENLADQQPVVLVIEDAHWADRSSRELLAFLARNLQPPNSLLVLVSYRTDDLGAGHPLRPLLAELERLPPTVRVELPRLSRAGVIAQIRAIFGGPGPDGLIEEVVRRSDGNPLFVEALLETAGRFPESLADLLLARVERLPDDTQRVLRAAAVAGARFGQPLLDAVTGLAEVASSECLRPAVAAGVLVADEAEYAFRHALMREAAAAGLLPGERKRLHARLAQALEADPELVAHGRATAEIAHHWHAAGEAARGLPAAWRAAADAAGALAHAEQLAMLDRVLEAWDAVTDAAGLIGASRADVLDQAVTAAYLAGEPERGVLLSDAALAEPGIQVSLARAFFIQERRSAMSRQLGHPDVAGLVAAADKVPDDDPARPRVLAALAEQLLEAQMTEEAREAGEHALAAARRASDPVAEAGALITIAALSARREDVAAQLPRLAEARALAEQAGAASLQLRAARWEASMLEAHGQHERAVKTARRGLAAAAAAGLSRTSGAVHAWNLAEALTSLGRWDEASEVAEHALSLLPAAALRPQLLRLLGFIALARGDLGAAAAALRDARDASEGSPGGGSCQTREALMLADLEVSLLATYGDTAGALAVAARVLTAEGARTARVKRFLWPLLSASARVAYLATGPGTTDELTALARGVLRQAAGHAASARPVSPLGRAHAAAYAAAADQAVGGNDGGAWDRVASAWEQLGEPYREAQALLHAAEVALAAGGDRDAAAPRLRLAADLADALAARPLREEISALARRACIVIIRRVGAPGGPGAAGPAGPGSVGLNLTPREFEVLRLVAAGRNNREIAAELFISAKTASAHVCNILAKLGVRSRVEAAAIAHRAEVTGTP